MGERYLFWPIILLLAIGCGRKKTEQEVSKPRVLPQDTMTRLVVALADFRMREEPNTKAAEIGLLQTGMVVETTGNVSPQKSKLTIRGVVRDEPWIEVKTKEGQTGWIFGGGVKVEGNMDTPVAQILRKERLASLFGDVQTRQILQYRTDYFKAKNSKDFENVYIRGAILRDSLSRIIPEKIQIDNHEQLPELSWLEDALPGYTLGMVAEGTTFYPFQDFDKMKAKAANTTGAEDDRYLELAKAVFDGHTDVFFPAWMLQTWDYGGHSLLGQGRHLELLEKMDTLLQQQSLFRDPVLKLKKRLLDDVFDHPQKTYHESAEKIITEIDAILLKDFKILTDTEKAKLESRKADFLEPEKTGLRLNQGNQFQ